MPYMLRPSLLDRGFNNVDGNAGDLTGANGGINFSNGRTYNKQTVLTSLTAGNNATITVGGNTDVKGAVIATLDSDGQDTGRLSLTTDTFSYADLSNTNYNHSQNLNVSTGVGINGGEIDVSAGKPSLQYKNGSQYDKGKTLATVGQGNFTIGNQADSVDTTALNRDTDNVKKDLFSVDRQQGNIDVTLDTRLLSKDGQKQIGQEMKGTYEAGEDVTSAADTYVKSDDMNLFDFGKSVSDNRKLTGLKNDLLSSERGLKLLGALKSDDADTALAAKAAISQMAQEKYGITPEQVNFYNADETTSVAMSDNILKDVKGGVVTDDDHDMHGEINVDVSDATTKTELLNNLGHETYDSITENTNGEQTAAQEDLADAFGNQFEDRIDQAAGGDLDTTVGSNWNSALQNSRTTKLGTERANLVGNANVDHRMYRYKEAKVMDNIRGRIDSDKSLTNNQKQQAKSQLSALACASVKCAEQVPDSDPYYKQLTDLQKAGEQLQANGSSLKDMLGKDAEGLFEHDWLDSVNDAVLKHDEGITKGGAIVNVVAGYSGAATSVIGGAAICTGGVTCIAGATLATVGADAGLEQGHEGWNKLNEDYISTVGKSTLNSESTKNHEGEINPVGDLAIDAALGAGTLALEAVIAKAGGKALDKVADALKNTKKRINVSLGKNADLAKQTDIDWSNSSDSITDWLGGNQSSSVMNNGTVLDDVVVPNNRVTQPGDVDFTGPMPKSDRLEQLSGMATPLDPKAYSVIYETNIGDDILALPRRDQHFKKANENLLNDVNADPELNSIIETLVPGFRRVEGVRVPAKGISPSTEVTWHHVPGSDKTQLVWRYQHEQSKGKPWNALWQELFHSNNRGGFADGKK